MHISKSISANWSNHSDEPVVYCKMVEFLDRLWKNSLVLHGLDIKKNLYPAHCGWHLDLGDLRLLMLALQQGLCCVLGNIMYMKGRWNSSGRIVTGLYVAWARTFASTVGRRKRFLSSPHHLRSSLRLFLLPFHLVRGVKWLDCEANHSSYQVFALRMCWAIPPLPYTLVMICSVHHAGTCTLCEMFSCYWVVLFTAQPVVKSRSWIII